MYYDFIQSPLGDILVAGDGKDLHHLNFPTAKDFYEPKDGWVKKPDEFNDVRHQLDEYFGGKRSTFDLNLSFHGTPFRQSVWRALCEIPYGTVITYGELARRIGNPNAFRAVGLANGANRLPIIIPCHRVVAAGGQIGGFSGGLGVKNFLLELEGVRDFQEQPNLL
ncbi:MAG: methylated-DNA--[protein]-cysteine S-methyltransferase [Alphaproteobacteria bacterium]